MTGRALLLVVLLHGCQSATVDGGSLPIEVVVQGDFGTRLGGVPIRVNGSVAGRTAPNGALRTSVTGPPGSLVRISQDCPDDHPNADEAATLRIRRYHMLGTVSPLSVVLRCRPELRLAAIVVRTAYHSGVVVHVDGERVGATNDHGLAHIARRAPPGSEILVELDAGRYPQLRPQRTSRILRIADSHDLFVIDQQYEPIRKTTQGAHRRRRIIKIE
jgi:hypothetical protein